MINIIPPHERPEFRSYAAATWWDSTGAEHQRYKVRAMDSGSGFEVVDIENGGERVIISNLSTMKDADDWMRENRAP